MTAEVMKSFGTLQLELEQAKSSLKNVDEHIKKILGRDPSENQSLRTGGGGLKRTAPGSGGGNHADDVVRGRGPRNNSNFNNRNKQNFENDEHVAKKRNTESVFKRLSDRPSRHFNDDEPLEGLGRNQLISKVIVTPKELPSRQDVLAAQGADEKSKARNRRMFGALLGTLQKFRQEETKLKPKEEKRAQVEKKLEEQQIREREELKKERQDLFLNRKKKQQEIRMIELKMTRLKELAEWEEKQRPLMHFIQTKAKQHIYYLPKIVNDQTKVLLEANRQNIEKLIDRKRQDVYAELSEIEQKMKRNYNPKQETNDEENKDEFTLLEDEDVEMKECPAENQLKKESEQIVPEPTEDLVVNYENTKNDELKVKEKEKGKEKKDDEHSPEREPEPETEEYTRKSESPVPEPVEVVTKTNEESDKEEMKTDEVVVEKNMDDDDDDHIES